MKPDVSIVIRAKNEERTIARVIRLYKKQTLRPKEIIVADNESSDRTVKIAQKLGCQIVNVPNPFNHALACNLGMALTSSNLVLLTNAHSYPSGSRYLENGVRHFINPGVAGVFGLHFPGRQASFWEKYFEGLAVKSQKEIKRYKIPQDLRSGVMSTVAALLQRRLWENYPFDQKVARIGTGGEDLDWSWHFLKEGYEVIFDPDFSVYHSHGDNLANLIRRHLAWDWMYFVVRFKHRFPGLWSRI